MHRSAAIVLAALVFALGAGCTFLISFDDVPDPPDATVGPDAARPPARDAGRPPVVDASVEDAKTPPPAATCDLGFPIDDVLGCETFVDDAQVCASNAKITYPAGRNPAGDLVTCDRRGDAGRATCVRHCTGPGGCASLPNGFPDQCDTCNGRADGRYCGSELGWVAEDHRLLVTCTNDRIAARSPCPNACTPNVGAALCR